MQQSINSSENSGICDGRVNLSCRVVDIDREKYYICNSQQAMEETVKDEMTQVRISKSVRAEFKKLAAHFGITLPEVLEKALDALREKCA